MAKRTILSVIEQTIGKYVQNLDAESLNVALWNGNIELHSLELNVDAVNAELNRQAAEAPNLALPFKVVDGRFASFEIVVPWARISSRPVVLRARGLKVMVEPCDRLSGNKDRYLFDIEKAEKEAKRIIEARLQSIKLADENRERNNAVRKLAFDNNEDEKGSSATSSFSTRLVQRIIENLQVEVEDVHVALRSHGSSAGVVLKSLSLVTTDKYGTRTFVDRTSTSTNDDNSFLYKALKIEGLGLYLDDDMDSHRTFSLLEDIGTASTFNQDRDAEKHTYILSPLSFEAKLRKSDSVSCVDFPKFLISSELDRLSIMLSRNQLELGNKIALAIRPNENVARPLFPEYRPLYRVSKATAKDWWRYAFRCINRLNGKSSWTEFYLAFQKRKRYIPLYKRNAHNAACPWIKALSNDEQKELNDIEYDRSISMRGLMTWRNIADAQVDKEREKHNAVEEKKQQSSSAVKKSYLSSFFGSSTAVGDATLESEALQNQHEEAPITLTVEEMKELETMTLEQANESEVSQDSKLYDLKFVLGSFKIDLISHGMRPITALDMGTVTATFDANADGSFVFDFKMSSLIVHDKATLNSLFPTVLRSLNSSSRTTDSSPVDAFDFRLEKSKTGDQKLLLQIVAFEMVASPILFAEVKRFFSLSKTAESQYMEQNPMLRQSLSGTVDLFYDAGEGFDDGAAFVIVDETAAAAAAATVKVSDKLSSAIVDAWKNKNMAQNTWTIDCDIHAPILIVPQNCVESSANVLLFDLGHLSLKYGRIDPLANVSKWFSSQPKRDDTEVIVDHGAMEIKNLTFVTSKAEDIHTKDLGSMVKHMGENWSEAIIEPVTLSLQFGIESASDPRICAFGDLPAVCLSISPTQASKVISVQNAWKAVFDKLGSDGNLADTPMADGLTILEAVEEEMILGQSETEIAQSHELSTIALSSNVKKNRSVSLAEKKGLAKFFFSVALRRLSIRVVSDLGDGMEAHLVSVSVSSLRQFDGSSLMKLRMGWFWVVDHIKHDFAREQRLVVHSNLPRSAVSYARNDDYNVLEELRQLGVFGGAYSGSSELADISWRISSELNPGAESRAEEEGWANKFISRSAINAKFTSLFVHWNPRAVKAISAMKSNYFAVIEQSSSSSLRKTNFYSPSNSRNKRGSVSTVFSNDSVSDSPKIASSSFEFIAEMNMLEISLNSARDDLPLFVMTMAGTKVKYLSVAQEDDRYMKAKLELGDLRIQSPSEGQTDKIYKSLLGLAPNESASLLKVDYCMGSKAIQSLSLSTVDASKAEAAALVELSPARLVYIHSQVFTLVDYITEGVLGAIFAKAASSAATVAREIASSVVGGKVFVVKAIGLELVLPQAARSIKHLTLRAGDLDVIYHSLPSNLGSRITVSLCDVQLLDRTQEEMVDKPIRMSVAVVLPPICVGSEEDQTMHVEVEMSEASFLLSKPQYEQILRTLEANIGEKNSFLRNEENNKNPSDVESDTFQGEEPKLQGSESEQLITHAGVAAFEKPRRMYINFKIAVLSLELCGASPSDPIVRMAAVSSNIALQMIPDEEKTVYDITLHNLVCKDQRISSMNQEFRSLIEQVHRETNKDKTSSDKGSQDVFHLFYVKYANGSSKVDISIGSPQVVLIPDAIAAVLNFISVKRERDGQIDDTPGKIDECGRLEEVDIQVDVDEQDGAVETSFMPQKSNIADTEISIKTSNCRLVLVDIGNRSRLSDHKAGPSIRGVEKMTEAIVLQGAWDAKMSLESEKNSGRTLKREAQIHGEAMEVFSAHGIRLQNPLQIFEPTRFTIHASSKARTLDFVDVDVRAVTLTPIEVMFSMQNAALLNAISASFSESFGTEEHATQTGPLSDTEALQIKELSSALENDSINESDRSVVSSSTKGNVSVDESQRVGVAATENKVSQLVKFKVTMPESRVTFINDLQGLDEALFRVGVNNFVAGAEIRRAPLPQVGGMNETTFDSHINTSIVADYFDPTTNLWRALLVKPWEVTFKAARGISRRFQSHRLSTTIDLESFPCHVSFAEHFLTSLGAASRMWSLYSLASEGPPLNAENSSLADGSSSRKSISFRSVTRKSIAASAARSLITTLPYAIENHAGIDAYLSIDNHAGDKRFCPSGSTQYFRFESPRGEGCGGRRLYGQDASRLKSVVLSIESYKIEISDIDHEVNRSRCAHPIGNNRVIVTHVVREGKTTVLHLSSQVDIRNDTSVPFHISVTHENECHDVGLCEGARSITSQDASSRKSSLSWSGGNAWKPSRSFGIPLHVLQFEKHMFRKDENSNLAVVISPSLEDTTLLLGSRRLVGSLSIPPLQQILREVGADGARKFFDVTCKAETDLREESVRLPDPFVVQICMKMSLIDKRHPFLEVIIEPRATIANSMPISICCRTPMPHTLSASFCQEQSETTHRIKPKDIVEIFTPGPSIAITVKCADSPVGGSSTDWMEGGWIDLPLVAEFRLPEPIKCTFPFVRAQSVDPLARAMCGGSEFFIVEDSDKLSEIFLEREHKSSENAAEEFSSGFGQELAYCHGEYLRNFLVTVCNYGVDHTGDVLFEQLGSVNLSKLRKASSNIVSSSSRRLSVTEQKMSTPFSAFASPRHRRRITLLPDSSAKMRLMHLSMEDDEGIKKSEVFRIEDIAISEGGIETTELNWEDNTSSGFYAYRTLVSTYQSEVHVIPEFIIFNGSTRDRVMVKQRGGIQTILEPGKIAPVRSKRGLELALSMDFIDFGGQTVPIPCGTLGLKVVLVKAYDGSIIGSLAIQTVIGNRDSRLVVKLGQVQLGVTASDMHNSSSDTLFANDFLRFRVRWSELRVTLKETKLLQGEKDMPIIESALDQIYDEIKPEAGNSPVSSPLNKVIPVSTPERETWLEARKRHNEVFGELGAGEQHDVATITLLQFTVDYQRIFKDGETPSTGRSALLSPERSQISVIIHNIKILDCTPGSPFPVVVDCTDNKSHFFDLCIRIRGPTNAALVKVDLFDLNLAYSDNQCDRILVETSEDFVWKLLDVANRIVVATAELAGKDVKLEWDEENGCVISVTEITTDSFSDYNTDDVPKYDPPKSDSLYDIHTTRVSPFVMILSFRRQPLVSRYKLVKNVRGAKLMNYFTRRLKFKIDKAELNFARYDGRNIKGPPDRLFELIQAFYMARLRLKMVTLMSAVSVQDWKYLAARVEGDDSYKEGDAVRATGNLVGSSASYILKKTGVGIGDGLSKGASSLGSTIEKGAERIGAQQFGAGVNSVVSGVGDGVGSTIKGVGSGTGKIFKGAGQGVGHLVGGVTGGAMLISKGIGKGITQGDGKAVVSGFTEGFTSVGTGFGQGVGSAVTGVGDGLLAAGGGLFSGVKSVGKGIGGAFTGSSTSRTSQPGGCECGTLDGILDNLTCKVCFNANNNDRETKRHSTQDLPKPDASAIQNQQSPQKKITILQDGKEVFHSS